MRVEYRSEFCTKCGYETDHNVTEYPHIIRCRCLTCGNEFTKAVEYEAGMGISEMMDVNFRITVINMDLNPNRRYKHNYALVKRCRIYKPVSSFVGSQKPIEDTFMVSYAIDEGRHLISNFKILDKTVNLDHLSNQKLANLLRQVFLCQKSST